MIGKYDPDSGRKLTDKNFAVCVNCGKECLKKGMIAVSAKETRYGNNKVICHFCPECYYNFLERYAIEN